MNPKENYLHEFFRIFFANKQLVKRVFLIFAVIALVLPLVLKQSPVLCNVPSTSALFLARYFGLAVSPLPNTGTPPTRWVHDQCTMPETSR